MQLFKILFPIVLMTTMSAWANGDVTEKCRGSVEELLNKTKQARQAGQPVQVNAILEVGPGTYDVDHLAVFSFEHLGGVVYKALLLGDSGSCDFTVESVRRIY